MSLRSSDPKIVLLVEDEPVLRSSMVRAIVKLHGVEVVDAGTIKDARKLLAAYEPGLLIADLDLPDGSGVELVADLDGRNLHIPIVFVSAFVGSFRSRLPRRAGIDVYEKPISMEQLRSIVEDRLGAKDVGNSPFSVADYVQLAGMGRRSVVVTVRGPGVGRGQVVVRNGEVWSASDDAGRGLDAFRRIAFAANVSVGCRPLDPAEIGVRDIEGTCESVLLDAARVNDEEANGIEPGSSEIGDGWDIRTSPRIPKLSRSFAEYYEEGVDALLSKKYDTAFRAFTEAARIDPNEPKVKANLARLRELGHSS